MLKKVKYLCLLGLLAILAGCSSGGNDSWIMGGTIQGDSLSLVGDTANFKTALTDPHGITTDGINLYWVDNDLGTVNKAVIATGVVSQVADGFVDLYGIVTDGNGNLYVTDNGDGTVNKIIIATGAKSTVAGGFEYPYGLTMDGANLYVTDWGISDNGTVSKVVISTGDVSEVADSIYRPKGITTDGNGNLYITSDDSGNGTISKIVVATGVVSEVTATRFGKPKGITTDGVGALYVADNDNNKVSKIVIASGVVTDISTLLNMPFALTSDGKSLFVTNENEGSMEGAYISKID